LTTVKSWQQQGFFSSPPHPDTFGIHPTPYPMDNRGLSLGGKEVRA